MENEYKNNGATGEKHILDGVTLVLIGTRGRIVWLSMDAPHLIGLPFYEPIHEDDRHIAIDALKTASVDGQTVRYSVRAPHALPPNDVLAWDAVMFPVDREGIIACVACWTIPHNHGDFSVDEIEVLRLMAQDCTLKQIARKVNRSESAIDGRIKVLKEKLKVNTLPGLVASAISMHII